MYVDKFLAFLTTMNVDKKSTFLDYWPQLVIVGREGGPKRICMWFTVVIDRTFGSVELFGRTFTVRFGPNDRTFFCRTQNLFSCKKLEKELILKCSFLPESLQEIKFVKTYYHINFKIFVCLLYLGFMPNWFKIICLFVRSTVQV